MANSWSLHTNMIAPKSIVVATSVALLLAFSGSFSRASPQDKSGLIAETPPLSAGALKKLYADHQPSVEQEKHTDQMNINVESPQLHIMPTEIDVHMADEGAARSARLYGQHQPIKSPLYPPPKMHVAPDGSKFFLDPAVLLNLSSILTQNLGINATDSGLNVTFNINPNTLTLTVTPVASSAHIFNPLNLPLPLKATTISLPINNAFALLNITGPVALALTKLLTPASPLTWLLPPPYLGGLLPPPYLGGLLPQNLLGGLLRPPFFDHHLQHQARTTTTLSLTTTITSTSVSRAFVTETSTSTYTSPRVVFTTIVIPSTSTSTIIVPKYETMDVVVTQTSTSTVFVPVYSTTTLYNHQHHQHHGNHHGYQQIEYQVYRP